MKRKRNPITTLKLVIKSQKKRIIRKQRKENYKNKSKTINGMGMRTCISIITSNINGLNAPTKRYTG